MKKIFTLIAGMLLFGGSAFAQERWTDLVINGNMEGAQDPKWSSFWCHDWRRGLGDFDPESEQRYDNDDPENGQFQGFAEIIEDPANPANHCARVIARSEAEADEAGNKVAAQGSLASWDCQFFIYAKETVPEGKMIKMTLKVKADKAGSFETQAHWKPGDYNHYVMFGNINVTTEWQTVEVETTLTADQCKEGDGKFFQSVAFNLSTNKEGNVFYFDDVKLEIKDPTPPSDFEGWFNFLRKGTESEDQVGNFTTFTGRDGIDGIDKKARLVADPVDGQPALNVTSIGAMLDANGEPIFKADGTAVKEIQVKTDDNGEEYNDSIGIDNWQTQFFVTIPHTFKTGEKFKLVMQARADQPCTVETQVHGAPGGYIFWQAVGNLELTEEWQDFTFPEGSSEEDEEGVEVTSDQNGFSTIAFNCNVLKEVNNYYFRFTVFAVNQADVTDNERIMGKETIYLPVPDDKETVATAEIDMAQMMETLGVENLKDFVNDNTLKVGLEEGFSAETTVTMGVPVDANGYFTESLDGIIIGINDENMSGSVANFEITNEGAPLGAGSILTKFCFVKDGWYYVYNITLVDGAHYAELQGIADVNVAQKNSGIIYDLTGRKVSKAVKGLYIMDGKKFFKK